MKKYYSIKISETSRNRPKDENPTVFNIIHETFKTWDEVKAFIKERYGKMVMPNKTNKVYQDPDGKEVGYSYTFWNKDWSHNSKSWYQTDWIYIEKVQSEYVILNKRKI